MSDFYWLIEKPDSPTDCPLYLCAEGDSRKLCFGWSYSVHAIRFARKEDANIVANISRTLQPELWEIRKSIGLARVIEHGTLPTPLKADGGE